MRRIDCANALFWSAPILLFAAVVFGCAPRCNRGTNDFELLSGHPGLIFAARTLIDRKPGFCVFVASFAQIEMSE
jgi:hypothetical protein